MSKALSCLKVGKSLLNKLLNYSAHTSSTQTRGKRVYTEIVSESHKAQSCLVRKFYDLIFQCQPWMGGTTMAKDEQHLLGWRSRVKQDVLCLECLSTHGWGVLPPASEYLWLKAQLRWSRLVCTASPQNPSGFHLVGFIHASKRRCHSRCKLVSIKHLSSVKQVWWSAADPALSLSTRSPR